MSAAESGCLALVEVNPPKINMESTVAMLVLCTAFTWAFPLSLQELIARGVDVEEKDAYEDIAVGYASKIGDAAVLKVYTFLEWLHSAPVRKYDCYWSFMSLCTLYVLGAKGAKIDRLNKRDWGPAMYARHGGHADTVEVSFPVYTQYVGVLIPSGGPWLNYHSWNRLSNHCEWDTTCMTHIIAL